MQPWRARQRRLERDLADESPDAHVERRCARELEQLMRVLRVLELELLEDRRAAVLRPGEEDARRLQPGC